jgi:hypothetical protein
MKRLKLLFRALVIALPCIALFLMLGGYFIASYQYECLVANSPVNQAELEKRLFFYTTKVLSSGDRTYGWFTEFDPPQYGRRYMIMGTMPIDAVYEPDGRLVTFFCTFE